MSKKQQTKKQSLPLTLAEAFRELDAVLSEASPVEPMHQADDSTLASTHAEGVWQQVIIMGSRGFWAIDMGQDGPVVQSLRVAREGQPYTLSNEDELLAFEQRLGIDHLPWPGNVIASKKRVI